MWWFSDNFFFLLSVWSPYYTLRRKKVRKIIHEGFGSTWGYNFHMGTQNGSKLEIWPWGILIHVLELKLRPFKVFPYVCIGKPCICNVFRPRATWGAELRAHINVTTFTKCGQNWSISCLLALYGSTKHPAMWWFPDLFFLLSAWSPCYTLSRKKIKKYNSWGVWEHLGRYFLHEHAEWVQTRDLTLGNLDSHLRIKVTALWSFPICLYREATHLQCFESRCALFRKFLV